MVLRWLRPAPRTAGSGCPVVRVRVSGPDDVRPDMSELAHLFGDYVAQSDWMATRKTSAHGPALAHAVTYTACFLPLTRNPRALAVIGGTHFVIDRWRLARHVVWAKNQLAPAEFRYPWSHGRATGYHGPYTVDHSLTGCDAPPKPDWMAVWLMIIADNTLHLAVNRWALRRWG